MSAAADKAKIEVIDDDDDDDGTGRSKHMQHNAVSRSSDTRTAALSAHCCRAVLSLAACRRMQP